MKSLKFLIPLVFVAILLFPMALFAQDTSDGVTLLEAVLLVQQRYGSDVFIREVDYEADEGCWKFHLADGTEFCVDQMTGEFTFDDNSAEATAEATDDNFIDCNDDDSDDDNGTSTPAATDDNDDDCDDDNDRNRGSGDDSDDDSLLNVTPAVSLEEAIAIALVIYPDAIVNDAELEDFEDSFLVWDIEFEGNRSVDVDAQTGEILFFGFESNDDDSNDDRGGNRGSNDDDDDSNDDNGGSGSDDSDDDDDSNDDSNDDNSGSDDNDDDDDNSGRGSGDDSDDSDDD
jgi:hypothetical protein